jgi:hypothetical protein
LPLVAQQTMAQGVAAAQAFRSSYEALLESYDRIFQAEHNLRGQQMVARAKAAMAGVTDDELANVFSQAAPPDLTPAVAAMQHLAAQSQSALQSRVTPKSLPLPGAPAVIDDCNNTVHDDQSTYDALIAFQVTSGILAAAAWVCNEDILGENGSLACVPLAIANDIASSLFAVRSFCASLDTGALVSGSYTRLEHLHSDLSTARTDIINNSNANTTAVNNNISTSTTSIINTVNAGTTSIVNNNNANTAMIVSELRALGCEIVRLLNTPEGQRASSILACSAQPSYPYSWNKR